MVHFIETQTKEGQTIRIEVEDTAKTGAGFTRQSSPADLSSDAVKDAYEQTLSTIRGFADGVVATIQGMEAMPNSASVEFAIKVDAETGPMIAKSRESGQFRVSLSWKQPEPEKDK